MHKGSNPIHCLIVNKNRTNVAYNKVYMLLNKWSMQWIHKIKIKMPFTLDCSVTRGKINHIQQVMLNLVSIKMSVGCRSFKPQTKSKYLNEIFICHGTISWMTLIISFFFGGEGGSDIKPYLNAFVV